MTVFTNRAFDAHEQVVFAQDPISGLHAIMAIHNTSRGPSLGGCRMWPYPDEAAAITDVLRLSRGMTYKSALANLPFGGGKSVIIGDPKRDKSTALFEAMGRAVDSLGGSYTVAEDVGISVEDVETMATQTRHATGTRASGVGDPSPGTAFGVFHGIRAAVRHRLGRDDLSDIPVAVQGLGHVGYNLCRLLSNAGARLYVSDLDAERSREAARAFDARTVAVEDIIAAQVEVFSPCALGGVINDAALQRLQAKIIAGAANNQLAEDRHGQVLKDRGILYAPDYVINAGGIINISHAGPAYNEAKAFQHIARIHDTLLAIFQRADKSGTPTSEAANRLAEERFTPRGTKAAEAA